jgi:hypothetical protein
MALSSEILNQILFLRATKKCPIEPKILPGLFTFKINHCTDKKEQKIFLIFKEIQMGAIAKEYI